MSTDEGFENEDLVGVSEFLPRPAALALVRASLECQSLLFGSLQRRLVLERVIKKVRAEYPEYFREDIDAGERPRRQHRRGASKRKIYG